MKLLLIIVVIAVCAGVAVRRSVAGNAPEPAKSELKEKIRAGALVVDVRSPAEFAREHLPGAINVPYREVAQRLDQFGTDRNREIVLYCTVGGRAGKAEAELRQHGFTRVYNGGGIADLREEP